MTLAPGTILNNRYRIVSILGQGGMGAVYQAFDESLGIHVAVKENLFLTHEYARQFQREANILASVHHPNLPRVGDYFSVPNQGQYLVMDYIDGEDLRQRIERMGTLPERDVILIGASMCEALAYLHSRQPPIIHRDIKPGNIKITPEGYAQLVDFGLAKMMVGGEQTTTGARAMTPGYSPPEQYGTAPTDARTDIYSLGATLYAALTGMIPEDGLSRATGKAELTPLRELNPKISRKVALVLETALAVDADKRYQSADEFKEALLNAGNIEWAPDWRTQILPPPPTAAETEDKGEPAPDNGFPYQSKPLPSPRRPARYSVRRRKRSPLAPILLTLVAILTIFFLIEPTATEALRSMIFPFTTSAPATQTTQPTHSILSTNPADAPAPTETTLPEDFLTPEPSLFPIEDLTATPSVTPTAFGGGTGQIAFSSNRTGSMQIWLMNADGTQQKQITNMPDGACQPAWSPDGIQIAFISPCLTRRDLYEGSKIYLLDLSTSSEPFPLAVPPSPASDYDPNWSPDGYRIAFTSTRAGNPDIYVFNMKDHSFRQLTNMHYSEKHPAWSPTGTQIAYVRDNPSSQVWVMSDTGQFQSRFTVSGEINDIWPVWSPDGTFILFSQMSGGNVPWLASLRYEERNTTNSTRVPPKGQQDISPVAQASISPDGGWITYESWPDGSNHDIYIMTINGANRQQLTTDKDFDFSPVWRPIPNQTNNP